MLCKSKKEVNAQKKECCLFCFPCSLLLLLSHIWVYLHKIREITRKVGWVGLSVPLSCLTAAGRRQRRLVLPPETRAAEEKRELSEWECVASFLALCLSVWLSLFVCLSLCLPWLVSYSKQMPFNFDGKRLCYRWETPDYLNMGQPGVCAMPAISTHVLLGSFSILSLQFLMHLMNVCLGSL